MSHRKGFLQQLVAGTVLCLAATFSTAGSLGVGPTLIELGADRRVEVLRVTNTGSETTIVQIETVAWSQRDGTDAYSPTNDLAASPEVFELKPGAEREVRVGLRDGSVPQTERSYRLYAREVVPTDSPEAQLVFAVRIGVPVFVRAAAKDTSPALSWQVTRSEAGCRQLRLRNEGPSRTRINRLELMAGDAVLWNHETPLYVLAGATRVVDSPLCQAMPSPTLLRVTSNARTLELQPGGR